MRYGLPDLSDGRRSELRRLVSTRMEAMRLTPYTAADELGLSANTLLDLAREPGRAVKGSTFEKLTGLGFTEEQLRQAHAADRATEQGISDWPPDVYRVAIKAMQLDDRGRRRALAVVSALVEDDQLN